VDGSIDLLEAIYTTRSLRRFRPDPIPEPVLRRLVEAATRAPSGRNLQPWRFVLVRRPDLRRRIGQLYRQSFDEVYPAEQLSAEVDPHLRRVMTSARYLAEHMADEPPVLVLVCLERPPGAPRPTLDAARIGGSTVYPAVQNLLLAARAHGVGGCLTTVHVRHEAEVKAALCIPEATDTYALVPLGFPRDRFGPLRRRPVEEVAYADRWGEPFRAADPEPPG
jgi:nitroreductase